MNQLDNQIKTYSSGFTAQIVLRPKFIKKFMGIIVDFGGSDPQKIVGSAHFLEHKLFAKSYGNISKRFEEINVANNAFTSYNETMFYCDFIEHWPKVLPLLFELVGETFFTKENVKKESEIIAQELAMYQDDPNWKLNYELMQMMFPKSNLAEDLTGTKEALKRISPAILDKVYQDNYVSSNMQFVACGDFSKNQVQRIFREVNKLQKKFITVGKVSKPKFEVTKKLEKKNIEITGDVSLSKFGLAIKLPNFSEFNVKNNFAQILLEIMFEAKFGEISSWYDELQRKKVLNNPLDIDVTYTRQGNFATIFGTSNKSDEVLRRIKSELIHNEISEDLFNILKKDFLAKTIRNFDNIENSAIEAAEMFFEKDNINQAIIELQTLSFSEFCIFFSKIIAKSDIFTVILNPKAKLS